MSILLRDQFIKRVAEAASQERLVIFIGAGVSKISGLPLWSELIQPIAEEVFGDQPVPSGVDLAEVADAFARSGCGGERRLRDHVWQAIREIAAKPNNIHRALPGLKVRAIFTTNYDDLLMDAFKDHCARRVDDHSTARYTDFRDELPIYHLHGHIDTPNSLILTRSEYLRYSEDHPGFMKVLEDHLTKFTVLFLGYGGGDEHFKQLSFLVQQRCPKLAKGHFSVVLSADPMTEFHWKTFNADVLALNVKPEEAEAALAALLHDVVKAITPPDIMKVKLTDYQGLTSFVSEHIDRDLREIQSLVREERLQEAEAKLRQMKTPETWAQLSSAQKANVYRNLIQVVLRRRDDADEAEALILEAETECADHRFVASRAELSRERRKSRQFLASFPEPQSSLEWRWKLLLMLECGKNAEVLAEITSPPPQFPPDVQTQTLAAWAHLGMRDIEAATLANDEVLAANPKWASNIELQAIIRYWRCIAPAWDKWLHTSLPVPVPRCAILMGPEIMAQLQQVADAFGRLAALSDTGNQVWGRLKSWQLAALILRWQAGGNGADDPFMERAKEVLDEMLSVTACIPQAVAWAESAELDYAAEGIMKTLRTEAETGALDHADALCMTLILQGREEEAARELDRHEHMYAEANALSGWRFHRVQLAYELHDESTVTKLLSEAEQHEERLRLEVAIGKLRAVRAKNLKQCLPAVRALAEATGKMTDLFDAAKIHLESHEPKFALEHSESLLSQLPSFATFDLLVSSATEAKQWRRCLNLIEAHIDKLPQGRPQIIALGLKVDCLSELNLPHEAASLAKAVALQSNNPDHLMPWFNLAQEAGDVDAMVEIANRLRSHEAVVPAHKLHVARKIQATHPQLATALLNDLLENQDILTPHESIAAWHLATRLGRESEFHDLLTRGLVPDGPLIPIQGMDEIKKMFRESRKASEQREKLYANGHAPIHVLVSIENEPLSRVVEHAIPEREQKNGYAPLRMWSLKVRHGSRQEVLKLPNAKLNLFLDVTSVLMLHRLGVLPKVVEHSVTIHLSPFIRALLVSDIQSLGDTQLSIIDKYQRLIKEVEAGRLNVIPKDIATALSNRGRLGAEEVRLFAGHKHVLVDFWPVINTKETESSPATHQTGPCGLLSAMAEAGWLTEADVGRARTTLDSFRIPGPQVALEPGSTVVLAPSMVDSLIDAGWLDELLSRCEVWISPSELGNAQAVLRQHQNDQSLIEQLKQLNQWLADEVTRGHIVYKAQERHLEDDHPLSHCLSDVVDEKREASVWTVCDDRWLTSGKKTGMSTVLGTLEILQWLRNRDAISEGQHHGYLLRFRLGNCRYIPLTEHELMYHLQRGINQKTGDFQETKELSILRKYTAAMMLDQEVLQMTIDPAQLESSEMQVILSVYQTVAKVLGKVWASQTKIETKQAQAGWLIDALAYDVMSLRMSFFPAANRTELSAKWEGNLFVIACMELLESLRGSQRLPGLREMMPWLVERLAKHPSRSPVFVQEIGDLAEMISTKTEDALPSHQVLTWLKAIAANLPGGYNDTESLSPTAKAALGTRSVTKLGKTEFPVEALWPAIAGVLEGKSRIVVESLDEPPVSYELLCHEGDSDAHTVHFETSDEDTFSLSDEILALAHPDMARRLQYLASKRLELDVRTEDADSLFTAIAAAPAPEDRVHQFLEARQCSVRAQFDDLEETFQKEETIQIDALMAAAKPKGVEPLLRHARLPSVLGDAPVDGIFENAAGVLIRECGLRIAFFAFASLPRMLPGCIVDGFRLLSADEKGQIIEEVEGARGSVIHRLHLSAMLIRENQNLQMRAVEMLTHLSSPDSVLLWRFHGALLRWAYNEVTSATTISEGESEKLAACWLFAGVFHSRFGCPEEVEVITSAIQQMALNARQLFSVEHHVARDVASPLDFSGRRALVFALPHLYEIGSLSESIQTSLRTLVQELAFGPDDQATPQGTILHLQSLSANRLGSFLVPCDQDSLSRWFVSDEAGCLTNKARVKLVYDWCSESITEGQPGDAMTGICTLTTGIVAPEPVREAVGGLLNRFTFTHLEHWEPKRLQVVARFLFLQAVWHRSDDEEFWLSHFREFSRSLFRSEGADCLSTIDPLLDIAHQLSLSKHEVTTRAAKFAALTRILAQEHPDVAHRLWIPIARVIVSLEGKAQAQLWRVLTELRAIT